MTTTTPATQETVLHVPVRRSGGTYALRLFRQRDGGRCAVAFTRPEGLTALLGPGQASARLSEPALRALAEPLGVTTLVIDPQLIAAPVAAPTVTPAPRALTTTP